MERNESIQLVSAKSGRAKVVKIELPEPLVKFNTANNTLRVRVVAVWAAENSDNNPNDCSSVLRQTVGNNEFSQIANLDGFAGDTAQAKVDGFKTAVIGKYFTATKYSVSIANLAKDMGETYATLDAVNDPIRKRTYTSLSDCTLDAPSDDDKVIIYERLVNRLQRRLTDKRLFVGRYTETGNNSTANTQSISTATGAGLTL